MNILEQDIDEFVKDGNANGVNFGRKVNAKIVYIPIAIANLKVLYFGLYS